MQVHAFAQAGGADLCQLNLRGEVFAGKAEDGERVDLPLLELFAAQLYADGGIRDDLGQRAFAFAAGSNR